MSAWIVPKKHVDLIVAAIAHGTRDGVLPPHSHPMTPREMDALGQMLVKENVQSVRHLRPDDKPGEEPGPGDGYYLVPYRYEEPGYRLTAAELYKAVGCYRYQSCEHPGWETSKAHKLCEMLQDVIAAGVLRARLWRRADADRDRNTGTWPEYEVAPWGFDTAEIAALRAQWCESLGLDPSIPNEVLFDYLEEEKCKS